MKIQLTLRSADGESRVYQLLVPEELLSDQEVRLLQPGPCAQVGLKGGRFSVEILKPESDHLLFLIGRPGDKNRLEVLSVLRPRLVGTQCQGK
jgi:hypothetical protein